MKATHIPSIKALRFGVALISLGCFGCASTLQFGTPRQTMAKRVDAATAQVAEVNGRLDVAQRALNDLANHPARDLRRQYDTYSDALNRLESAHTKLQAETQAMEDDGREYLVNWDRQIATIQDEDLRNRTTERRNEVSERIDNLHASYINAREAMAPVLHRLEEIRAALKLDLTSAGVESVRPATENSGDLDTARNALNELAEAFRQASIALSASVPVGES